MRGRGGFDVPGWGRLWAVWEGGRLLDLSLETSARSAPPTDALDPFLAEVARQVRAYFCGSLRQLDLPYILSDQPIFSRQLWLAAQETPYGQVVSYGGLAARAGNPRAARAAGHAMSVNRLFLIVPCHRVIAADGKLGGYGDHPELKAKLLALEGLTIENGKVKKPR